MASAAFDAINLGQHCGAHPRLGVVDDIVCHLLAQASLDEAAWLAKQIAAENGNQFYVPVYLYSAAHPTGKAPETIRRELGYSSWATNGLVWLCPKIVGITRPWPNTNISHKRCQNDRCSNMGCRLQRTHFIK